MKIKNFFTAGPCVLALALLVSGNANASTFPLTSSDPDVTILGEDIDYLFTEAVPAGQCYQKDQSSGDWGTCGTGGGGPNGFSGDAVPESDAFGELTVSASVMLFSDSDVGGSNNATGFGGSYGLFALYDDTGAFVSGSIDIVYSAGSLVGPTTGDTLLSANLYDFTMSGSGNAPVFEFLGGDTTLSGWMIDEYGGTWAGIILGATATGGDPGDTAWNQSDFLASWSGTTDGDTFAPAGGPPTVVPIPGALWLFGSGLLGLFGVSRKSNKIS